MLPAIPDDEALRAAKSGGYMIDAFNRGATGNGELAKILAAITDDL